MKKTKRRKKNVRKEHRAVIKNANETTKKVAREDSGSGIFIEKNLTNFIICAKLIMIRQNNPSTKCSILESKFVCCNCIGWRIPSRGLRSRAWYQTRQDWMRLEPIPELPGPGRYYKCLVPLLGKIREKFEKNLGRDYSVPLRKSLEWSYTKIMIHFTDEFTTENQLKLISLGNSFINHWGLKKFQSV